eukprot:jgi/Botrbrau1/2849/Bobra.0125s0054.2
MGPPVVGGRPLIAQLPGKKFGGSPYNSMHSLHKSRDLGGEDQLTLNGHSKETDREMDDAQPSKPEEKKEDVGSECSQEEAIEQPQKIYLVVSAPGPPVCEEPVPPDHLELSWNPSTYTGCRGEVAPDMTIPEIDFAYMLELQEVILPTLASIEPSKWQQRGKTTVNPHAKLSDLRPGRSYAVRVICKPVLIDNDRFAFEPGQSLVSLPAIFNTTPTPPSAPQAPTLSAKEKRELAVRWKPPAEVGGRNIRIEEYILEARSRDGTPLAGYNESVDGFYSIHNGPDLPKCRIKQLRPNSEYQFRVKARNCIGESDWSEIPTYRTLGTVPSQPQPPEAMNVSPTSATIRWIAPDDNGSRITEYILEQATALNGQPTTVFTLQYRGDACEAHCDKLQSGTSYLYRVAAYNEVGKSTYSLTREIKTLASGPGAPGIPRAVGENRSSVTVEWRPPTDDGGSPVTHYQLELQPRSKAALQSLEKEWLLVYEGTSTAHTQEGLRAGCTYEVRVRAANKAGFGPYSPAIDIVTAPDVPTSPGIPRAVSRSMNSLVVEWGAPGHDVRRIEDCGGEGPALSVADSATFTTWQMPDGGVDRRAFVEGPMQPGFPCGLDPGTWYALRVFAVNGEGASCPSPTGVICTKPAAPLVPGEPRVPGLPGAATLHLVWDEPIKRGSPITSYTVELCLASDLHPVAPVEDPVVAEPDEASDVHEEESVSSEKAEDPKEPSPVADPPLSPLPETSPFSVVYTGALRTCEVKGLEPYTEYAVRLKATSAAGSSEWGPAAVIRTGPSCPSVPENLVASGISADTLEICWDAPLRDNGLPVLDYILEMAIGGVRGKAPNWHKVYHGPDATALVRDLRPAREYQLRVRASNARGHSPWSEVATARTCPASPGAPAAPVVCSKRTASSLLLKWEPPLEDNGAPVRRYRLLMAAEEQGPFTQVFAGPQTTTRVETLKPDTTYWFQVIANNGIGDSPASESTVGRTPRLPPQPPVEVSAAAKHDTSASRNVIVVTWQAAENAWPHAEPASHEIVAVDSSSGQQLKATCGKACCCEIVGGQAGHEYQVRIRSAGTAGAGHSEWSNSVVVKLPGAPSTESSAMTLLPQPPASLPGRDSSNALVPVARNARKNRDSDRAKAADKKAGVSIGKKPPRTRSWKEYTTQQLKFLWKLILVAACISFLIFIGVLAVQEHQKGSKRRFP